MGPPVSAAALVAVDPLGFTNLDRRSDDDYATRHGASPCGFGPSSPSPRRLWVVRALPPGSPIAPTSSPRPSSLVFATVGMDGRLDLRTSELRILSRLPDARGAMFAHRVDTGGWSRAPLGETCSTTGDLVDISDSTEAVQTVQRSRCVWSAMIAWLRLLPVGATAAAHGDVPLPAGATPILGAPQRPLYEMLTPQPRLGAENTNVGDPG